VTEGWILAGILDGAVAYPRLTQDVCGIPHVLRLACDLALSGADRIYVIWNADGPPPDLSAIATDPRLAARAPLTVVRTPPAGTDTDEILVARADRLFHRDLPKRARAARRGPVVGTVRGDDHDAVFAAERAVARCLAAHACEPGGIARELALLPVAFADLPYAGFTARASGPRSLRRAERALVHSLRKDADGLASKAINRHLSLPITHLLSRTRIHPNHITLFALSLALAGAVTLSRGGYLAGVIGMLLVELGSIVDGCDGELARLRFQFSRTGQWLDTTVDDLANIAYITGVATSLAHAGATWAVPVATVAVSAFIATQLTQYALISLVYKSGDLAAIPWALQTGRERSIIPKLAKRDFVVTLFVAFALLGRLDWILATFASGAVSFFVVFFVQLARRRHAT
jgi:1L-myo-inositol 1-phosphate cytidylyltransferase / CDP-L-myo-inositol myo-inositolphosphotransferase